MADEYLQTDISGCVQNKTTWLNEYFTPLAELIKAGRFRWEVFDEKDVQLQVFGDSAVAVGTFQDGTFAVGTMTLVPKLGYV